MASGIATTEKSFFERVEPITETGCWIWKGYVRKDGYGEVSFHGKKKQVHRLSYEYLVGPIPLGLTLDHLCRVTCCVNPKHLEPVTAVENCMRGASCMALNAKKTHCIRGHEFNKENTRISANGRVCRECLKVRYRIKRKRIQEENNSRAVSV
jgi:hypothetical protein